MKLETTRLPFVCALVMCGLSACAGGATTPSGTAGTTGGAAGTTGTSGATGTAGFEGTAGVIGTAGVMGNAGSEGTAGVTGSAGVGGAGVTGAAGAGVAGAGGATGGAGGTAPPVLGSLKFTRKTLHTFNYAEGIGTGDFNKDGKLDVVSGPFWWEGPAFDKKHQYFPPPPNNAYTDKTLGDWADYPYDVDGDGLVDSVTIMRPGTPSYWYKNPGKPTIDADVSTWAQHGLGTLVLEQSAFVDLTGEGKPQLVCAIDSQFGFFDVSTSEPWKFSRVAPSGATDAYAWWHGIGIGDLDGDGKQDFITDSAWYTRPAAGPRAGAWTAHAQKFKDPTIVDDQGPSQMVGYDVDGDGDDDVVTALNAHGYGVAWFENQKGTFVRHLIVGGTGSMAMNAGMIAPFSQPHALVVADIDGDGIKDLVTGKTFYAHPPGMGDPDADGTPLFYVFKLVRGQGGATGAAGVSWEPHLVDSEVGLGRQFTTADLNGDGKIDIAVASKHGAFLFFQQ